MNMLKVLKFWWTFRKCADWEIALVMMCRKYPQIDKTFQDCADKMAEATRVLMKSNCWCHKCHNGVTIHGIAYASTRMILCPECGNKRCPHASDHTLACTKSNEPGQPGSVY